MLKVVANNNAQRVQAAVIAAEANKQQSEDIAKSSARVSRVKPKCKCHPEFAKKVCIIMLICFCILASEEQQEIATNTQNDDDSPQVKRTSLLNSTSASGKYRLLAFFCFAFVIIPMY